MLTEANARDESEKGDCILYRDDLLEWGDLLSLAVLPDLDGRAGPALALLRQLKDRFGECGLACRLPAYGGNDRFRLEQAAALASAAGLPLMAVNDVLYHIAERRPLQDVVTAIRLTIPVAQAGFELDKNAERHLKPPAEMARLFRRHPASHRRDAALCPKPGLLADRPEIQLPGRTDRIRPRAAGRAGAACLGRRPLALSRTVSRKRCRSSSAMSSLSSSEQEIRPLFPDRSRHRQFRALGKCRILCQGRGSAANSVICYCLGMTDVEPGLMDVLFERFISTERDEPPDIDVDFEHERRDEVIAYIYEKYSAKRTALAASVVTYRGRSALREVAKAMGLSDDVMTALSSSIWGWSTRKLGDKEADAAGLDKTDQLTSHVLDQANEILEFPRHLSQHVGGFVITKDRLDEIVPIIKTAMPERKMVEWDKDDLDSVGLIKVDVLALGMLSCLRRAFDLLEANYRHDWPQRLELATIPKEEPEVYDMICRADTLGVFQIESRAQMSMLPRLKPRKFYDLVIEVAIVRPGPIQGDMVHPYLRRRQGKEKPEYPKPELEAILHKTLGVPLFQEQAMRIAIEAGGFSAGEADLLRRAMATFKRNGTIGNYRQRMIDGMVERGYERDFAERCFKQIEGFGEYGFPESHAASFALLVYASCWFKAYYPDVFCAAILNSQPMGFYQPAQLIRDASDHGVEIRTVDVNLSGWDCTLEQAPFDRRRIARKHADMREVIRTCYAVRLGFRQIKGLSEKRIEQFVARRGAGYDSVRDVWLRSGLDVDEIERLAEADAFRSLGLDRREALWAVRALDGKSAAERLPLFDRPKTSLRDNEPETRLPRMPLGEHVIHDYRSLGHSLKAHPLAFLRQRLDRIGITPNAHLPSVRDGSRVSVAGLVLVRQRPGKGNAIFLTLEDEKGVANVIVWSRMFERFRPIIMGSKFVRVSGKLQSESDVIHIVAEDFEDLTPWLGDLLETARPVAEPKQIQLPALDNEELAREARQVMPKGRNFQ